ncbi:hypothetical protein [Chryseobacterium vrystaatense]|uniref:Uncharacterized protein n=1 Tax=Chryseobacterium vrystaatense TaxID=307480 RepID=A0ABR4UPT5_9FLAO|nr:hypothetical protein [Chryseobacterium vrystaatense]KFF27100.1 hypothetical protein IW16_07520 [Chryseobacterium vrystaatense]
MENISFDYKIDLATIAAESQMDFESFDIHNLKGFFNGKIYVFFHEKNKRNFIVLETGIVDYLLQFDDLILSIGKGIYKTFTISCDYYSNNLLYEYSSINNTLIINEGNANSYTISCNYDDFKKGYLKFRKRVLRELSILYPGLSSSQAFLEYFG